MFLRKISLKIACRLAIKIETVSGPYNTCFWYALAPAVRNTSYVTLWCISYRRCSRVSKTRIAWARDRFYICSCLPFSAETIDTVSPMHIPSATKGHNNLFVGIWSVYYYTSMPGLNRTAATERTSGIKFGSRYSPAQRQCNVPVTLTTGMPTSELVDMTGTRWEGEQYLLGHMEI